MSEQPRRWTAEHPEGGRVDVDGVEWLACDPYPTWYRWEPDKDTVSGHRLIVGRPTWPTTRELTEVLADVLYDAEVLVRAHRRRPAGRRPYRDQRSPVLTLRTAPSLARRAPGTRGHRRRGTPHRTGCSGCISGRRGGLPRRRRRQRRSRPRRPGG
ncbi:hypothetical protein SEA_BIGGITYBASS_67 [Gordonia phage BiggityBass]|nr:hypothetical protein SEA_BIGGITYBASS_67 [Gordonia phage BiggityBass]